jgi:oxygen-dependent protoporphyrinogen oxidase
VISAFPQLYETEKSAGSVIRGLLRGGKKRGGGAADKPTLQTFRDGNEVLIAALAENLEPGLRCDVRVEGIRKAVAGVEPAALEVTMVSNGRAEIVNADRVILATPADQAAALLRDVDPQFEAVLQQIEYAPIAVVSLGYSKTAIRHSLEGFGFLVPRSSGLRTLGTVWNSSLFAGRAPEGHVLLTSFVGGVLDRAATELPETQIIASVHGELANVLGISQQPVFSSVWIYKRAIPQYNLGHADGVKQLRQLQAKHSNVTLAGNYLSGPALSACIEQAMACAQRVT